MPFPMDDAASNATIDAHNAVEDAESQIENLGNSRALMLLSTHPDYDENINKWKKYGDCFESRDIYKYVHQHQRESDDMYKARVERGYFLNYVQSVAELFVAYMFHSPVSRDPGSLQEDLKSVYDDADLCGNTYIAFLQDAAIDAQVYGHVGILVDAPEADDIISEKERKESNVRPYLTRFLPENILDWEMDKFGRFKWVKLELDDETDREWDDEHEDDIRTFLIWTKTSWEKWQVKGEGNDAQETLIAADAHDLGRVPFVIVRNIRKRNHKWFGESAVRDIADINIAILNWSSLGDEEIFNRCLNVLTMQKDPTGDAAVELGHHNVLEYAEGAHPPEYLTPGSTPLQLIAGWIGNAKDEIYRLAKLGGATGMQGVREATSGIAYAYEFNETNQALSQKAESMQQAELEIHRLISQWLGEEFDGQIEYPKDFGVDDFMTDLGVLLQARTTLTSDTAIKELQKNITDKMFARKPTELRAQIRSEIDKSDLQGFGFNESFDTVPQGVTNPPSTKSEEEDSEEEDSAE